MFEKEAEKYLKKLLKRLKIKEEDLVENQPKFISWEKMNFISLNVSNVLKAFQDGAEFGYNKADDNKVMADNYSKMEQKFYDNLTKAKVFIRSLKSLIEDVCDINYLSKDNTRLLVEAEQFLSEVEK